MTQNVYTVEGHFEKSPENVKADNFYVASNGELVFFDGQRGAEKNVAVFAAEYWVAVTLTKIVEDD